MLWMNQLNVVWASHLQILFQCRTVHRNHHVRTYCASICWNNHTWIICQIQLSDSTDRKLKLQDFVLSSNCCACRAWRFYLNQLWLELWEVQNFVLLISYLDWFLRLLRLWYWTDDQSDIDQASWYKLDAKLNVTLWQHRPRSTLTLTQGLSTPCPPPQHQLPGGVYTHDIYCIFWTYTMYM